MKTQQIVAALILIAVVAWMVVPRNAGSPVENIFQNDKAVTVLAEGDPASENPDVFTIRAVSVSPQTYVQQVKVRGRTRAFRQVQVRSEQAGRISEAPVERGSQVKMGDVLCEIEIDSRESDLQEAIARREQAEFEYKASQDLQTKGLQSDANVAQLNAALESAKAAIVRSNLALDKTKIRAPFDGIVETRNVELGDLLDRGGVCATVMDDSPMLLVGLVPENDIGKLSVGSAVTAELLTGEIIEGSVIYLSRSADPVSRSYRIEIEVAPGQKKIRDGITAEIQVNAAEISAHMIPSSALTLDDRGLMGVKLVSKDNRTVEFHTVEIVGDYTNQINPGVWVSGLNGTVHLITHGQEIVFPGQAVNINTDWDEKTP